MLKQSTHNSIKIAFSFIALILTISSWASLFFIMSLITLWLLNPTDNPANDATLLSPWERAIDGFFGSVPGMYVLGILIISICGWILLTKIRHQRHALIPLLIEHAAINFSFSIAFLAISLISSIFLRDVYKTFHTHGIAPFLGTYIDGFLLAACLVSFMLLLIAQYYGLASVRQKVLR